jgi:uncharacterized RDD family membrane protein YckC
MFCPECGADNIGESSYCRVCGARLVPGAEPAMQHQPASLAQGPKYAGFWIRALAALIDFLLSQVVTFGLVFSVGGAIGLLMVATGRPWSSGEPAVRVVGILVTYFILWLWFTVAESSVWQATVGKRLLGLKVTDETGNRISFGRANGRFWSKILSSLLAGAGFILIGISQTKQGLHDRIAHTFVVKGQIVFCPQCEADNIGESSYCSVCGARLVPGAGPAMQHQPASLAQGPKYAGFWIRALAALIDCVLLLAASFVIMIIVFIATGFLGVATSGSWANGGHAIRAESAYPVVITVSLLLSFAFCWLWLTVAESSGWQATVGKRLLGLKVTDETGSRISFGRANGRFFAKMLSSLGSCAGFIMVAFTAKRQGLHDKMAHTLVVKADT